MPQPPEADLAATPRIPPPPRRRSWRRRVAFFALGTVVVGCVIELGAWVAWWFATGGAFTWQRASDARAAARQGSAWTPMTDARSPEAQRLANGGRVLHPYLGFVYDPASAPGKISRWGFVDDAPPLHERAPDRFIVGIVGGSVALQLCEYSDAALTAALLRSPRLQGRRVEVVRLCVGGYKQPQQLMAVQLAMALGGEFDCVVCFDGFNDIALLNENLPHGVPAWFPRGWQRLMDRVPTPEQQRRLGELVVLREQRLGLADLAEPFWWSPTAQLLWLLRDRNLAQHIAARTEEAEAAAVTPSFAITGPGPASTSEAEARVEMASIWRRGSLQLHALCAANDVLYFHFLQPNQYLTGSKPMSTAEEAVAIDRQHPWLTAVQHGYPLLQSEGAALRAAGVAFEDLTQIFLEHPEPLYVDTCCHLNHLAYNLLAEHVAGAIRARLEIAGLTFERIRVSPPILELRSPVVHERFVVYGVVAGGVEHDITGTGFGTRASADPGALEVGTGGTVRARRRGRGELVVQHGRHRTAVPFAAEWPDDVELSDGVADSSGLVPELRVRDSGNTLVITCSRLPTAGFRFLVVSEHPIPAVFAELESSRTGLQQMTLDASQEPTVSVPAPAATGAPLFFRAVVLAPSLDAVSAASNTVVLTRG